MRQSAHQHGLLRFTLGAACLALVQMVHLSVSSADDDDDDVIPVENSSKSDHAASTEQPASEEGDGSGNVNPVSETHLVESGDTLWDLCTRYLNSPWYWPKIWSYNPQISNPHWIFPGNELRFYPSDENLPTNVEVSQPISSAQGNDAVVPDVLDADDLVRTSGNRAVTRPIPTSYFSSHVGFISHSDHDRSGQIVNSTSESYLLADYDHAYVKFKVPAKKGENYAVYRIVRRVAHPMSGESYGFIIELVGSLTVTDIGPTFATVQIGQSYDGLERGDFVGHWPGSFGRRVNPTPNQTKTRGYIIDNLGDMLAEIGQHDIVFIDKGRKDGVLAGNIFSIVGKGDRYTYDTAGLPSEDVGQAMVIDVQDKASTAVVTRSLRELAVGDRVEMRTP